FQWMNSRKRRRSAGSGSYDRSASLWSLQSAPELSHKQPSRMRANAVPIAAAARATSEAIRTIRGLTATAIAAPIRTAGRSTRDAATTAPAYPARVKATELTQFVAPEFDGRRFPRGLHAGPRGKAGSCE